MDRSHRSTPPAYRRAPRSAPARRQRWLQATHLGGKSSYQILYWSAGRPLSIKRLKVAVKPQRTAEVACKTACRLELYRTGTRHQSTASCLFFKSVISINPGACVMANGSLAAAMTACGVTPQDQNTGISSGAIGTASP